MNSESQNEDAAIAIGTIVNSVKSQIDKTGVFKVVGVHNKSRGFFNDIEETKAQIAINHLGKNEMNIGKP
jgi:NAD kinase